MQTGKQDLRADLIARRAAMTPPVRAAASATLAEWMVSSPFRLEYDVTVAAYVPSGTEPGSIGMLDSLADQGVVVLLPVIPVGAPAPLDWARYDGPESLSQGRWGIPEPNGPRLGSDVVRRASVILVPALAVDRRGTRLGRGAGYYDRSVGTTSAELVAVVYDHELVDELPADEHDVPMGWALTAGAGFTELDRP